MNALKRCGFVIERSDSKSFASILLSNPVHFVVGFATKLDPTYDMMHTLKMLLVKANWVEELAHRMSLLCRRQHHTW